MKVSLIASPYDLGRGGEGKAAGPLRYLEGGAGRALSEGGFEVEIETVERESPFVDEIGAVADSNAVLARRVRTATGAGSLPLVLGGNCDSALGALAGIDSERVGIVWFDAHGDFNTPETSPGGYLGGMPLAIATGNCHENLWKSIGGGDPVPESHVLIVGVRDLDPEEDRRLRDSGITVVEAAAVKTEGVGDSLREPLADLRSRVDEVYLHLDLDSLDPLYAPAVGLPVPEGLSVENEKEAIKMIAQHLSIRAAALTAFDPDKDEDDRTLRAGMQLIDALAQTLASPEEPRNGR